MASLKRVAHQISFSPLSRSRSPKRDSTSFPDPDFEVAILSVRKSMQEVGCSVDLAQAEKDEVSEHFRRLKRRRIWIAEKRQAVQSSSLFKTIPDGHLMLLDEDSSAYDSASRSVSEAGVIAESRA